MTETDNAYAAGFFDGEGSISIAKPRANRGYTLSIGVGQRDSLPLIWLQDRWGGSLRQTSKGTFMWEISSAKAGYFLKDILPYLLAKRAVAVLALELQATKSFSLRATPMYLGWCETIRLKIMSLNAAS